MCPFGNFDGFQGPQGRGTEISGKHSGPVSMEGEELAMLVGGRYAVNAIVFGDADLPQGTLNVFPFRTLKHLGFSRVELKPSDMTIKAYDNTMLPGRPWIHQANAVASALYRKIKFIYKGTIVTIHADLAVVNTLATGQSNEELQGDTRQDFSLGGFQVDNILATTEPDPTVRLPFLISSIT
ncbi:hypothetical protein NE237_020068 [Protea cynaroides]|uniref:Uncharacterized protein n=1 Tax=Protea cynaroides TaxID=273540 RepID=A0A9Q0H8C9_9MAGN|nr:hypothetical protein NE237_020068 [Protea cynaroides]